jgi:general secretion pathway protein K
MMKKKIQLMPNKRKGIFLVFALWILVLLSLFCLGMGFRIFIQTRKTRLFINKSRAFYLAVSGVKIARGVLKKDKEESPDVDYLGEDWAKLIDEDMEFSSPKREGKLVVKIEDEASRMNINSIAAISDAAERKKAQGFVSSLFEKSGIDDAEAKAAYILDYIDEDSVPRSSGMDDSEKVKNANISVFEELLFLDNISANDYDKIKGVCTLFGDGKVNINTAGREVLDALIGNDDLIAAISNEIFGDDMESAEDDEYYNSLDGLKKDFFKDDPVAQEKFEELFKVNSNAFRVISEAEVEGVKKKITCVVDRDRDTILYWHEQ